MPFLVFPDPLTFNNRELLVEFAAKNRVPAMFGAKEFVDAGGLASYGPSYPDMHVETGTKHLGQDLRRLPEPHREWVQWGGLRPLV